MRKNVVVLASLLTICGVYQSVGASSTAEKINWLSYGKDTVISVLNAFGEPMNYLHDVDKEHNHGYPISVDDAQKEAIIGFYYDGFFMWFENGLLHHTEISIGTDSTWKLGGYQAYGIHEGTTLEQAYSKLGQPSVTVTGTNPIPRDKGNVLVLDKDLTCLFSPKNGVNVWFKNGSAWSISRFQPSK